MFLEKVRLTNFCQHSDRTIEFSKGLNVIIGPNGSGKSNILNGIYGALTGDFSRNAGKTSDNISINKVADLDSAVDLEFSHGTQKMRMLRRLDPADRQLTINGKHYFSDKEVADRLMGVLEVDKDILNQYVFVEQWDLFGPLSLSPAKRIAAFQKLFKIEQLNKISEELSQGSLKLAVVNPSSYNLQELTALQADQDKKIAELETSLNNLPTLLELDQSLSDFNDVVNNWKRKTKLLETIASRKNTMNVLVDSKAKLDKAISEISETILEVDSAINLMEDSFKTANETETSWVKYDYYVNQKTIYENNLNKLLKEKENKTQPVKPEGYVESEEDLRKELDDVKFRYEQCKQFVSSIDVTDDSAACPTCGTPAKNLIDKWQKAQEDSNTLLQKVLEITEQINANRLYDKAFSAYLTWQQNFEKRMEEVQKLILSLNVETVPELSREEAKKVIKDYNALKKTMLDLGKEIAKVDVEVNKNTTAYEQQEQELNNELEELKKYNDITEESFAEIQNSVIKIKADKVSVLTLTTELAVIKTESSNTAEKIDMANKQIKLVNLHSSWNERVESLKKIFKYNALPVVVSHQYMARVVVELNKTLSEIGVAFNIELEKDLSFTANFGSHKVSAARLSGGQKVILTIAYRLAVNFTFATNLGLLCLDEPTVGLDEANLGSLERAFDRLKNFSLSNGVQIVVVTHEKGISHLFDHTIDLSKV